MKFNEKDMLLIEDYLDGKLTTETAEEFKKRLKTDNDFAKVFELRKSMPTLLKDAAEFESTREEVRTAIKKQKQAQLSLNRNWLYVAATIVILAGLFLIVRYSIQDAGPGTEMADENNKEMLKTDEPKNYAKLNTISDKVELISPLDLQDCKIGEKVILKWKTESSGKAVLFVKRIGNSGVLFQSEVPLSEMEFVLEGSFLTKGNYNWYLNDSIEKGSFRIISGK